MANLKTLFHQASSDNNYSGMYSVFMDDDGLYCAYDTGGLSNDTKIKLAMDFYSSSGSEVSEIIQFGNFYVANY